MLEAIVFTCGAVLMILEIVGSRVLAPFLGTSVVIWTSLIGVILGFLSLGYWLGGRVADRSGDERPSMTLLARIILAAGAAVALLAVGKGPFLELLQAWVTNLYAASVLAAAVLFGAPSVLLGMVSPLAVKLGLHGMDSSGSTVGRLYALSTVGSIAGTFLAGFVLLSALGVTTILFLLALTLALVGLAADRARPTPALALAAAALLLLFLGRAVEARLAAGGEHAIDTDYNHILVRRGVEPGSGRKVRVMSTDPGKYQAAMYLDDPAALVLDYTKHYLLVRHLAPGASRILLIGGGGYSVPKHFLARFPEVSVDVAEIDPGVTAVAREFFGLKPDTRLTIQHEDGRVLLNRLAGRPPAYDAVFVDAFNSAYAIPFHLATLEAAQRVRAALKPGGVALVNLIAARAGGNDELFRALRSTYLAAFPRVEAFAVDPAGNPQGIQNIMLAAFAPAEGGAEPAWASADPALARLLATRLDPTTLAPGLVLRDDYAPVEKYLTRMLMAERAGR